MFINASTGTHLKSFILAEREQKLAIELFLNNMMLFLNIVPEDKNDGQHVASRSEILSPFLIHMMISTIMLRSKNRK